MSTDFALPDEILVHCLLFADIADISRFARVCKFFRSVANDDALWIALLKRDFRVSACNGDPCAAYRRMRCHEGHLYGWGDLDEHCFGYESEGDACYPVPVAPDQMFDQVCCGWRFSTAVHKGKLYVMGARKDYQDYGPTEVTQFGTASVGYVVKVEYVQLVCVFCCSYSVSWKFF